MKQYYLSFWEHGNETLIKMKAIDNKNLHEKLVQYFPDLDEILLDGFNFNYTKNKTHWFASGTISIMDEISISNAVAPAHFNPNFFYIIGYENINEQK